MIVGVDIGGTFTDVVGVDPDTGQVTLTKVFTDHGDLIASLLTGVRKLLGRADRRASDVTRIVIGTTVATNVVVQRSGARTLLLTTAGFEDILEIGRLKRSAMYDIDIGAQTPVFLAPRRMRVGVPERVDAFGNIVIPMDEAFVARSVRDMRRRYAIEAVAVVYLFSFENNAHELRTREIIESVDPNLHVSLSCEVNPFYREYERTVVTAFDAYMRPKVEHAMQAMETELRAFGIACEVYVMQSHGGVTTARNSARRPVNLFLSGPAGGVVGGARLARAAECPEAVTIDIGGTSCDVAIVEAGIPALVTTGEIAGFPVRVPMVDINTIGAGGGSLLTVDETGMMRVGPASAGSEPGPACYARGGTRATITDASLVLGYLNPHGFAGGSFDLDTDRATRALEEVGRRMSMTPVEVALGAHRIMNVQMAEQIRLNMTKRGVDARQFTLMAFGGAGPLHAGALVSMLAMKGCVIPPTAGVLSAFGLLGADVEVEQAASVLQTLTGIDLAVLLSRLEVLADHARESMLGDGIDIGAVQIRYSADLRYSGQEYEITVPIRDGNPDAETLIVLGRDFQNQYRKIYGHTNNAEIEIVNLRATAFKTVDMTSDARFDAPHRRTTPTSPGARDVWFLGVDKPLSTAVHAREHLREGMLVSGPAIIEQADTTIVVYPGQQATVDAWSNLTIAGISESYTQ